MYHGTHPAGSGIRQRDTPPGTREAADGPSHRNPDRTSRRGGGRRAASKHAQSKKKGQQHQGLESLYIHKRVKAPGGTLKTSEFGTVLGYDATRGWRVVYDKKRGRDLPKTKEIYVKDRAELVSMIDDCMVCDKDLNTFYTGQELLTDRGVTGSVLSKLKTGKWLVIVGAVEEEISRKDLVQLRGNYLLRHVYRERRFRAITGKISSKNELTRVPTGADEDIEEGDEVSRVMMHDNNEESGSNAAVAEISNKLRRETETHESVDIGVGGTVFTFAPGKASGGDSVNGAMHQDDAHAGVGNSGDRPTTFSVLLWVGPGDSKDRGGVVYFQNSEWDLYEETDDPVKNQQMIDAASYKYRTWTFSYEENAYLICDPDTWHYPQDYVGDSQCIKLVSSMVIGGEFDDKHHDGHLEEWMTEVKGWVLIDGSNDAGTKTSRTRRRRKGIKKPPAVAHNGRGGSRGCRSWETRFNELVQYKAKHGDCNSSAEQGQLGKWVDTQRTNYKKGNLSQDRIDRLNGIGFEWTLQRGRKGDWETRFNELVQYKAKHGDCNVPQRQGQLGKWVQNQRTRKGKLRGPR